MKVVIKSCNGVHRTTLTTLLSLDGGPIGLKLHQSCVYTSRVNYEPGCKFI